MTASNENEIIVKGHRISADRVQEALANLPLSFGKADFRKALLAAGWQDASDPELVRLLMQALKWRGIMAFDKTATCWQLSNKDASDKTLPLQISEPEITPLFLEPAPLDLMPWDRWITIARLALSSLACLAVIGALITLNASFAWELGREAYQFRLAFMFGLMALDLMRPFLVATAFAMMAKRHYLLAGAGFFVALSLAPVSILSSTAILSASFLLGSEMQEDEAARSATLQALRNEHQNKVDKAEQLKTNWQTECARGGCGPIAAKLEQQANTLQTEAQGLLREMTELTKTSQSQSDLLARLVMTFQALGLFGADRQLLLPLFLAISLELAALFGPALLLRK